MDELTITPQGHLLVRETTAEETGRPPSKALVRAFRASPARGMLHAAVEEADAPLPAAFDFARSIARLYLADLCKVAAGPPDAPIPDLPPPAADLDRAIRNAPPLTGLEYLTLEAVTDWWRALDDLVRVEVAAHPAGVAGYLRDRDPRWRFVGRVTFHLAENKRDADHPFAFLATFANGLTAAGKVKHEPLARALQQYAGSQDRDAMLALLLPISKAAESSELVRKLVDSGDVYHPLAWSPRQAYNFLRAIPTLEASGLIVRVPDWWNAKKPTRPQVNVKVDSKKASTVGVDAILDFSVDLSLDGEPLDPRRDGAAPRIERWPRRAEGEVGRGRQGKAASRPRPLEAGRAGGPPRGDDVLRGDAPPLRGEPGRRRRQRRHRRRPRVVGPGRRPGAGGDPPGTPGARNPRRGRPAGPQGRPPPVPADGLCLAPVRRPARPGGLPGRRHGFGKDRPGDRAVARPAADEAETRQPPGRAGLLDRQLEGGAGPLRPGPDVRRRAPIGGDRRARAARTRRRGRGRPGHHDLWDGGPDRLAPRAPVAAGDPRRGAGDQELGDEADPRRQGTRRRRPGRPDRHADRKPPVGPLVAVRLPEPRPARHGEAVRLVRQAAPERRTAVVRALAEPRPPVHPPPAQDRQARHRRPARQDRAEGLLHPEPAPGRPLSGRRGRTCRAAQDFRGHPAPGDRPGAVDAAQADLQPPRPGDGHPRLLPLPRAASSSAWPRSSRRSPRGRKRSSSSPSSARSPRRWPRPSPPSSAAPGWSSTAGRG